MFFQINNFTFGTFSVITFCIFKFNVHYDIIFLHVSLHFKVFIRLSKRIYISAVFANKLFFNFRKTITRGGGEETCMLILHCPQMLKIQMNRS